MPLLNYTTQIDVEKTIGEIQRMLGKHGASAIMTEYKEQVISSISFQIPMGERKAGFKLPSDWRPVLQLMKQDPKVPQRLCVQDQAVRVAWRIVKDWVEAQMALIDTQMVTIDEVFLPYMMMKGNKTLSETMKADPKFLLGDGK